ncbi:hypothetical protein ASF62_08810 [Leifsonia sp. Leaf325]|nr:hypothetical protein ASF62_08810 [Leifsonia sp. Leaf325]
MAGLIGGLAAGLASTSQTEAQWSDAAVFSVSPSTGMWPPPSGLGTCTIIDAGGAPVPGETCSIATVDLIEQGGLSAGALFREYRLTVTRSTTDPALDARFRLNLASPDIGIGVIPNPDWSWDNASTSATPGYTTAPGYLCSSLPILDGILSGSVTGAVAIDVHDYLVAAPSCAG